MAWRAAQDLREGWLVNLGLGIPVLVADYVPKEREVFFHSENGIVGVGPTAAPELADPDLVDAGSQLVTLAPGASIVDSSWSFAMIRGGHIDVTILGAFEVAANGDLANWDMQVPHKGPLVGGGMDLAACARSVWAIMEHTTQKGAPRLLEACRLPLTALRCVTRIYTNLAMIAVEQNGFVVEEIIDGLSREALQACSGAKLHFAAQCKALTAPAIAEQK
jgi:3-oxoacid CoA-transferase B subunit